MNNDSKYTESLLGGKWRRESIDNKEVWICESDNTYQIKIGEKLDDYPKSWATSFPDPSAFTWRVYLCINGAPIKQFTYVYCDGMRYFVPLPMNELQNGQEVFYWQKNETYFKLARIIGVFQSFNSIEEFAAQHKITIK